MSESARLSRMLSEMRQANILASIQNAKAISKPCDGGGCGDESDSRLHTATEGEFLQARLANNFKGYIGRIVGAESSRIQGVITTIVECSTDPFNPDRRFAQYAKRIVPPVCPTVPQVDLNANLPKSSTKCPLPNKPYFPSIY